MEERKHFVLVHGACLGAWCCTKSAIDLGASGVNSKRLDDEIASISDYLQPLMEFMACLPQEKKVILVGHSYSGLCISLTMENFHKKISVAVFISAYMPHYKSPPAALIQEYFNRTPVESLLDCQFTFNKGLENPPTSALFGAEYMKTVLCKRCKLEDLELTKMLVRPTGFFVEDLSKESLLTKEKFGSVDRVYVICKEDEVMKEVFQRAMIEDYHPKQVVSISAAGHMVMLSKPEELCQILLEDIAHK
ncbi:methylesterase 10 [Citrus sinensis]|nr:methylesterase 10 [Citrus sinensis]